MFGEMGAVRILAPEKEAQEKPFLAYLRYTFLIKLGAGVAKRHGTGVRLAWIYPRKSRLPLPRPPKLLEHYMAGTTAWAATL